MTRRREWLWPGGMTMMESIANTPEADPWGALWVRHVGETDWRPIPGRGTGRMPDEVELRKAAEWTQSVASHEATKRTG